MKKAVLLFLLIIASSSCSDDDFAVENRDEAIKGQWSFRSITLTPAIDLNNDGVPNTDGFEEVDVCIIDDLFFFGDTGGENNVFRINENASRCLETPEGSTTKFRDIYSLNDEKTIITFAESDLVYFIQELSENTLELEFDEVIDGQTIQINYIFNRD